MKKRIRTIVIITAAVLTAAGICVFTYLGQRITMNPPGTVGNTAGNLNNGGLFCEYDGYVYFSNPYSNHSLYRMDSDEGNIQQLNNVQVCNILAGGKFLYYFQLGPSGEAGIGNVRVPRSFNRCKLNGENAVGLLRDVVVTGQLVDNYLYLLTAGETKPSFYKLKIDKSEKVELADYSINPACASNGTIYYNGSQDNHYLYALDTATDISREVWRGNLWYPLLDGDYIYYMDVSENYRLCRYSLTQDIVEVLTEDRVDCFNVGNGYIYYQKNSQTEPQLKGMRTDGSDVQVIAEGNYTNINMTSQYVYFQVFGEDTGLYHMPIGGVSPSVFDGARAAAMAAQ